MYASLAPVLSHRASSSENALRHDLVAPRGVPKRLAHWHIPHNPKEESQQIAQRREAPRSNPTCCSATSRLRVVGRPPSGRPNINKSRRQPSNAPELEREGERERESKVRARRLRRLRCSLYPAPLYSRFQKVPRRNPLMSKTYLRLGPWPAKAISWSQMTFSETRVTSAGSIASMRAKVSASDILRP